MQESNQETHREQEAGTLKKVWRTPKLSILDIKTATLGGKTPNVAEQAKGALMS